MQTLELITNIKIHPPHLNINISLLQICLNMILKVTAIYIWPPQPIRIGHESDYATIITIARINITWMQPPIAIKN